MFLKHGRLQLKISSKSVHNFFSSLADRQTETSR